MTSPAILLENKLLLKNFVVLVSENKKLIQVSYFKILSSCLERNKFLGYFSKKNTQRIKLKTLCIY